MYGSGLNNVCGKERGGNSPINATRGSDGRLRSEREGRKPEGGNELEGDVD